MESIITNYKGFNGCVFCDKYQSNDFFAHVNCWSLETEKVQDYLHSLVVPYYLPEEQHLKYLKMKISIFKGN